MNTQDAVELGQIWGSGELSYSRVVAQTLALSRRFRQRWFNRVSEPSRVKDNIDWANTIPFLQSAPVAVTEKDFGQSGRIDMFLEFGDNFVLGIENKTFARLRECQLKKYASSLQGDGRPWFLVFLAPFSFRLNELERPESNFAHLSYREIKTWLEECLLDAEGDFERDYFRAAADFCGELEMQPLTAGEIDGLAKYSSALSAERKLRSMLNSVQGQGPVTIHGQYVLKWRQEVGLAIYFGFRIGTDWYYNEDLLQGRPEALVYVKDEKGDPAGGSLLAKRLEGVAERPEWKSSSISATAKFYPRKSDDECRLAIRRSLESFDTKDGENIVAWFDAAIECLLKLVKPL